MIMEAMRLSLIDHEEQQRKQREEEAKKARETAGGPETAQAAALSPSAPSSQSGVGPGGSSASAVSLPPITHDASFSADLLLSSPHFRPGSGAASGSGSAGAMAPSAQSAERSSGSRKGHGHSMSALDAALRSVVTTAGAIGSPPGMSSPDSTTTVAASASARDVLPQSSPPLAVVTDSHDVAPSSPAVQVGAASSEILDDAATEASTPLGSEAPTPQRMDSYASSMAPSNYDVLLSSPESSPPDSPLLDRPSSSRAPSEADSSESAATS